MMLMKETWYTVSQANIVVLWNFQLLSLCTLEVNSGLKTVQSCSKGTIKYSCLILASFEENIYIKWANYKYHYKDK